MYFLMKDAMKGVFPSLEPEALVRTQQDTQSIFFFFLFFFFLFFALPPFQKTGFVPLVAKSVSVERESERRRARPGESCRQVSNLKSKLK